MDNRIRDQTNQYEVLVAAAVVVVEGEEGVIEVVATVAAVLTATVAIAMVVIARVISIHCSSAIR